MATVLIVEDDPNIRRFVTANLRVVGHTVLEAVTGEAALTLLFRWPIDVLLLDTRLPDMSAWDFLESMSRVPRFGALPVILATASLAGMPERRSRFPQIADVITKPVTIRQLVASVDCALAARD